MSYNSVVHMSQSHSLILRVAACAAELGNTQPTVWAANNIMGLVATAPATLQTTWDSASVDPNANPDTGEREDVIMDAMILSAVTAAKTAQAGTQGWA